MSRPLSAPQGTDITLELVDRLRLHSALGIEVNSVGVPKLASAVRLLHDNPELTADTVFDLAPALLDDPAAAGEWRDCVAENHLFFSGEPLRRRRRSDGRDDAGSGAGEPPSESDSSSDEGDDGATDAAAAAADADAPNADALALRRADSGGAGTSGREFRDGQLAAFVAEGTACGRLPDFSVAVNRNGKMWLAPLPIEAPHQEALTGG